MSDLDKINDQIDSNIQGKLFSGSFLMMLTRFGVKSIGLVSIIILARLLAPEDFGLIAMATAVYGFIELFSSFGLNTVLIQRKSTSNDDYNTAWTFKLLFGIITAVLLVLIAPYAAFYFDDPRLKNLIYLISITALFNGFSNVGIINFQKDLNFRKEMKFQIIPKFINFFVIISLAFTLRNYWALAIGIVFGSFISFIASYLMHPYRARLSLKSARSLMSFSKWLIVNNALTYAGDKLISLVIGRMLGASSVGFYSMTNEIASIPTVEIAAPINKASFPVYSKLQDNDAQLRNAYLNTISLSSSITMPAAVGIALIAPYLIAVALGDTWMEAVFLMQILALTSFFSSLYSNINYIYTAVGRPKVCFFFGVVKIISIYTLIYFLTPMYGVEGIGFSLFITSILMFACSQLTLKRSIGLSINSLGLAILRPTLSTIIMCIAISLFLSEVNLSNLAKLIIAIAIGVIAYSLTSIIVWKLQGKPIGIEHKILSVSKSLWAKYR
ncbi:lipopolysaccharide biosynthesis protein [Alkalimonas sp. MEB108]|uniref:Lipopolysaccharide biosynthesis protein n=1 Tax=Alkalimonas cellulosilytica TaxID=3058395 RepID=A0ABU7J328_9GAMM|nr:lipopolysaccharide biosynthesis protein [Alkalimonas sp. MEB108]MEE2000427.1 lipopolysaccharide biosynthesis protein [Alkalimonas sp. MEB108]